jgi:hypothetical protein
MTYREGSMENRVLPGNVECGAMKNIVEDLGIMKVYAASL